MRVFLQECAEIEDYNVDGMPTWACTREQKLCCSSVIQDKEYRLELLSHQWPPADKTEKPLTKTDELLAGLLT